MIVAAIVVVIAPPFFIWALSATAREKIDQHLRIER